MNENRDDTLFTYPRCYSFSADYDLIEDWESANQVRLP